MLTRLSKAVPRVLVVVATASLLAGARTPTYPPAEEVRTEQASTLYRYYADASYSTIVGYATEGCGEPYTLISGYETQWVLTRTFACPY